MTTYGHTTQRLRGCQLDSSDHGSRSAELEALVGLKKTLFGNDTNPITIGALFSEMNRMSEIETRSFWADEETDKLGALTQIRRHPGS